MNVMDPSGGLSLSFKQEVPSHWRRSRDCSTSGVNILDTYS
jgi:hypothetical protein